MPGLTSPRRQPVSDFSRQILVNGVEHIVSCPSTGQWNSRGAGKTACGLLSLNFARVLFAREQETKGRHARLQTILAKDTDITSICPTWSGDFDLEVQQIATIPVFDKSLKLQATKYGFPGLDQFMSFRILLSDLLKIPTSAALVITRPPYILTCLNFRLSKSTNVFIIFDPHPRQNLYPDGGGVIINTSLEATARRLIEILPVVDLPHSELQRQAQPVADYFGHVFVPRSYSAHPTQTILEASLEILALRMQVANLTSQNASLMNENKRVEWELETMAHALEQERLDRAREVDFQQALLHQQIFDEEDRRLRSQLEHLCQTAIQRTFECSICFDEHPEDDIAPVEGCGHTFCRECMKDYVASMLSQHRFPILCPTCRADGGIEHPGVVGQDILQALNFSEEQHRTWTELSLVEFSVLLHCRQCGRSAWVDRNDMNKMEILACPLRDCKHVWCKACQQAVEIGGPPHSCDGSSELDHLMRQRGWKYCPTCRTPIQKEFGCNHMTCGAPACNTHFCYVCGDKIVQSALQNEIANAVSTHYANCNLFEEVPDIGAPP